MRFTLDINSTCLEALSTINETDGKGLIVLDSKKPIGFINDGDIRRLILNGGRLTDNVSKAMRKEFIKMKTKPTYSESASLIDKGIKLVPIISDANELIEIVDVISILQIPIHDPRLVGNELKYLFQYS